MPGPWELAGLGDGLGMLTARVGVTSGFPAGTSAGLVALEDCLQGIAPDAGKIRGEGLAGAEGHHAIGPRRENGGVTVEGPESERRKE